MALAVLRDYPAPQTAVPLVAILEYAAPEQRAEALRHAMTVLGKPHMQEGKTLAVLAPVFDASNVEYAIKLAREMKDRYDQREALTALAIKTVTLHGPERALQLLNALDSYERSEALVGRRGQGILRAGQQVLVSIMQGCPLGVQVVDPLVCDCELLLQLRFLRGKLAGHLLRLTEL